MSNLSAKDLDTLNSALSDAIAFSRQDDQPESQSKKKLYIELYNKLFMSDSKKET